MRTPRNGAARSQIAASACNSNGALSSTSVGAGGRNANRLEHTNVVSSTSVARCKNLNSISSLRDTVSSTSVARGAPCAGRIEHARRRYLGRVVAGRRV